MGYQCFHCLHDGVVWDSDFSFEDYGYEGEGIIHVCHCTYCGAVIEYAVPIKHYHCDNCGVETTSPNNGQCPVCGAHHGEFHEVDE